MARLLISHQQILRQIFTPKQEFGNHGYSFQSHFQPILHGNNRLISTLLKFHMEQLVNNYGVDKILQGITHLNFRVTRNNTPQISKLSIQAFEGTSLVSLAMAVSRHHCSCDHRSPTLRPTSTLIFFLCFPSVSH